MKEHQEEHIVVNIKYPTDVTKLVLHVVSHNNSCLNNSEFMSKIIELQFILFHN